MWEKASPAKKNHPLKPHPPCCSCPIAVKCHAFKLLLVVLALIAVERCAFNSLLPHILFSFQVCSKLRSVCLLHLHLWPNFWTRLLIQNIRAILNRIVGSIVLPHLHYLVRIQSHNWNWLQHPLFILTQLSPTSVLPVLLSKLDDKLPVLHQIALPDPHLKTIVVTARKNMILFYVPR